MQVIARVITSGDYIIVKDDIFVVKTPIANDKFAYTSYVYDGAEWKAMDGNYNAENVYFDEDLTFTKEIGYVTLENGSATLEAKGKNIKQVFQALFAKEEDGTVTPPSATISVADFKAYEVGTTITNPRYTTTFDKGSYQYGPDTGVSAVTYTVTFNGKTVTGDKGNLDTIQVTDGMSLKANLVVDHTAGAIPLTNLGNESETENIAIAAGQAKASSGTLSGYRKMFWGFASSPELTSATIRALANSGTVSNKTLPTITAQAGDTCVIVAIPSADKKTLSSVTMPSSLNAPVTGLYIKQDQPIKVEGAEGYTAVDYDVWLYQPTKMSEGADFSIVVAKA